MERVEKIRPGRECWLFMDEGEAARHDPLPGGQKPPIVHVDRAPDSLPAPWFLADEAEITALVDEFDGAVFAGT